ncbi:SDR family oxidoreductase [Actinomadura sp. DC4]|uniref:SDR family NAD(P)-dependent oxidoreductase n=1 Tax=Actinomadura sp. DC4 TaxID=3055069 RepID=UPI0025AFC492|nr:SDR family oxidoreductase [Actinomadura sp. DC4]MDN3356768.1 SDR family oxidoreductase [Actinomadura sp. DC4]
MYPELRDKVVLITGGSHGIGAGTARAFAAEGADVAVVGRDRLALDLVTAETGGVGIVADVTRPDHLESARARAEEDLGPVDILCAFAGMSVKEWHGAVGGNLTATFLTLKEFLPGMRKRRTGSIITMSSSAGRRPSGLPAGGPEGTTVARDAAKADVQALTMHVAAEVASDGVRVNCLAPGARHPERTDRLEAMAATHPLGRTVHVPDVAGATLYLASGRSSWPTGLILDVAGGRTML